MRLILLAMTFLWPVIFSLIGCTPQRFSIGNGLSASEIKITPRKGPNSVYRVERNV